jgi:hypothetical protein
MAIPKQCVHFIVAEEMLDLASILLRLDKGVYLVQSSVDVG